MFVSRNVTESAAALFDNLRSAPVAPSKDDKKGRKKGPAAIASDFRANEMKMTDTQRMDVMMLVRDVRCLFLADSLFFWVLFPFVLSQRDLHVSCCRN